jgi:VanZ like family
MTTRRVGWALSVVVLAVVLVATLTPSPGTPITASFWCIACGEFGALDVAANIVMFVPLGLAFSLATGRRWPSVIACVVTTLLIEGLQVRVIIGRDASINDLLANSLGGWLGTELAFRGRALVRPTPVAAGRLGMAWAAFFALICGLASAGLRPASIPRSLWVQWLPARSSFEPFTGRLRAFDINGIDLPLGFPSASLGLDRVLAGTRWRATATVSTTGLQPTRSVIARVAEEFTVLVSVEQDGWNLVCYEKTAASDFKFRSPKVALRDAFRSATGAPGGTALTCARSDGVLIADANGRVERLRLSPSLGWLMLFPFDVALTTRDAWSGVLWLFALVLPAGYWYALSLGRGSARRRAAAAIVGGTIAALALGLAVFPALAGVALATPWEWAGTLGGLIAGAATAHIVARMFSRPS